MPQRTLSTAMLAAGADGNRKHTTDRQLAETLRKLRPRIDVLPVQDRMLIELCFPGHMTLREFARLYHQDAGSLSRRQRTLWRRLHEPILDFLFSPIHTHTLPPEYRQIGVEHHLLGISLCDLADKHRMTKPQIQQILGYLQGVADIRTPRA